jgi:PIN domain nuclease of toxin-antitoxin system
VILLDTHVLIWWANGDRQRLSATALAAIDAAIESAGQPGGAPGPLVSAISFDVERWLALLASHPAVRLLALDTAVAVAATRLPEPFHADPADRFLVAQARELGIPQLSADSKIRSYGPVRSLW